MRIHINYNNKINGSDYAINPDICEYEVEAIADYSKEQMNSLEGKISFYNEDGDTLATVDLDFLVNCFPRGLFVKIESEIYEEVAEEYDEQQDYCDDSDEKYEHNRIYN